MDSNQVSLADLARRLQAVEDQLEIMRLLSTYGPAVDSGSNRPAAELWIGDGVYDVGQFSLAEGQDAIEALYESDTHQWLIHEGSAHITASPQITLMGDRAEAIAHSIVVVRSEEGYRLFRAAANHWVFVRTEGGWRIETRTNRVLDGTETSHALLRKAVA